MTGWQLVILPDERLLLVSESTLTKDDIARVQETFETGEITLLQGPLKITDLRRDDEADDDNG